jgi:hypothetical protein
MTDYKGDEQDIGFAKFFVLNAKVLKEIRLQVHEKVNKEWVSDQYRLLEVGTRASEDAQLKFIRSGYMCFSGHDLSTADPFSFDGIDATTDEK